MGFCRRFAAFHPAETNTRYGNGLQPIEQATRPPNSDNKAHVQIDKGLISKLNVFAGVKAGIQVTGALNWAPPAEVVALSAYPVLSISGKQELSRASSWLTLARLSAEVGAQGEFALSLHKGRLILYLKASLISGPGASGSFRFEVGYDAIVDILNLFRRELHRNNNQPLKWVDPAAADYLSKMTVIGALGLDPGMVYLMAYDKIMSLYEALTRPGRGGPIAHTIVQYGYSVEIRNLDHSSACKCPWPTTLYASCSAPSLQCYAQFFKRWKSQLQFC